MTTIALINTLVAFVVAVSVLWANPLRTTNRVLAVFFVLLSAWSWCVYNVEILNDVFIRDDGVLLNWLRANTVIAAVVLWVVWCLKEAIIHRTVATRVWFMNSLPWFVSALILAALSFTDSFFTRPIAPGQPFGRGTMYFVYTAVELGAYLILLAGAVRDLRAQSGVRRVELQFLVYVMGGACVAGSVLNGVGSVLDSREMKTASFPLILVILVTFAWATTVRHIFSARQVFLGVVRHAAMIGFLVVVFFLVYRWLLPMMSSSFAQGAAIAIAAALMFWLDRKTRGWVGQSDELALGRMRKAVIAVARTEANLDRLVSKFEALLRTQADATSVRLLFDHGLAFSASGVDLAKGAPAYSALCDLGWATPESLERRRTGAGLAELAEFLATQSIALIITVPRGSPNPSLLIAVGTKKSEWPFTHPEVERIQSIAELMDNILTRSRLTDQAALQAKMEHLAMMSRGLAHDLKNLITPISTFLVHTRERYEPGSAEDDVHTAARRSVRIMTDYVSEALFFANRLEPKFTPVTPRIIMSAVIQISRDRAARRGIKLETSLLYEESFVADAVLIQRLLANLVANAIDASESGTTVRLSIDTPRTDWVRLEVKDHGSGVAPDHLGRIFEPYFTTKEFGDDVRGFGLGLTICQKIVDLHRGTISVQSQPGCGATFTVDLPTTQGGQNEQRKCDVSATAAPHADTNGQHPPRSLEPAAGDKTAQFR